MGALVGAIGGLIIGGVVLGIAAFEGIYVPEVPMAVSYIPSMIFGYTLTSTMKEATVGGIAGLILGAIIGAIAGLRRGSPGAAA